jgi:hypothetical protein
LQIAFFSVSNEHQEQGAKVRDNRAIASLSNAAIGVHGQRKTAICGLPRYSTLVEVEWPSGPALDIPASTGAKILHRECNVCL